MKRPDEWDAPAAENGVETPDTPATPPDPNTPERSGSAGGEKRGSARPVLAYLTMAGVLFGKVLVARWLILGVGHVLTASLQEAVMVLALLGVVELFFSKRRFAAYVAVDVAVSLSLVVLTEYVTFYERMLEPGALRFVGQVGEVGPSLIALLTPWYLLYAFDFPLIAIFRRPLRAFAASGTRQTRRFKLAIVSMLALAVASVAWAVAAPREADPVTIAQHRGMLAFETASLSGTVVRSGLLAIVGLEQSAVANPVVDDIDYSDARAVQDAIDEVSRRDEGQRIATFDPGAYAGSHIIAIQVESLQQLGLQPWAMPNLSKLASESWYFPNGVTQSGLGTTSDAEFAMNASLYPPTDEAASIAYVDREIPALPRLLADQAYYSFTMHANTIRFWNRKELYPALGFADYYDRAYFGQENTIGFGTSDRQFFKKALPVIAAEAGSGPVYCQLITVTTHHPFKLPRSVVKLELPDWLQGSTIGRYLEAMDYEDRQLGYFVDQLKKKGLWENSIVVIYGDHAGLRHNDLVEDANLERVERLLGHPYTPFDSANVPIIIHLPGQTAGVTRTAAAGQVDIMPTIADALGLDLSGVPHVGRSLFESDRPFLVGRSGLSEGSFINQRIVCEAGDTLDSSDVLSVKTRKRATLTLDDRPDWAAARTLEAISHAYVESLPERASGGTEGAIIPRKKRN